MTIQHIRYVVHICPVNIQIYICVYKHIYIHIYTYTLLYQPPSSGVLALLRLPCTHDICDTTPGVSKVHCALLRLLEQDLLQ